MDVSLRYMYHKALAIEPGARIADEHVAPLHIEWIGIASTRFASHGGFLYFVSSKSEVPAPPLDPHSMFGCVVDEGLEEHCVGIPRIVVPRGCDLDRLFNHLVSEIERYRAWHNLVVDLIATDAPYQDIVDAAAEFVPRPQYIADSCWRMIARVDFEMPEISATWHYQTLHGGLYPLNIVESLNRTGEYQMISNLTRAQLIKTSESFVLPIIAKPIRSKGKLVGYYFMIDTWGDLGFCETEVAQELGKVLAPVMASRGEQYGFIGGFQDAFVTQVIGGTITDKAEIARRLRAETCWNVESDFRMATTRFKPDEFDNHLLQMRTMGLLVGDFDNHAYFYKDMAVAIFRDADENCGDFLSHLQKSASTLRRTIVVSNRFRDFSKLAAVYEQNDFVHQRAEGRVEYECSVISCDSNYPHLLADHCKDVMPVCYEAEILREYDLQNNTHYCLTLLTFLSMERNALAAADALFVHRNTLRNHLNRISQIIDANLDDPSMRLRLIISLNILINAS